MRSKLTIMTLMAMATTGYVQADNLLAVAPFRLILSDDKTNDLLTLTNRSEHARTYKLVTEDQVMQPDGNLVQKDNFEYSAKRMLRFMPREITLQAGQRQNVRVMAMVPDGTPAGDYHTHLIFQEMKQGAVVSDSGVDQGFRIDMQNLYNVGVPIVVQHGKVESGLVLTDAKLGTNKQGQPVVNVEIARTGNGEATAMVTVVDKTSHANATPPRNMHVYHEVDTVTLAMPLSVSATENVDALVVKVGDKELGVRK